VVAIAVAMILWEPPATKAQGFGNTISGRVTGVDRRPIQDMYIELLDDLGRSVGRTRSDGVGFYKFSGVGEGRFTVRLLTVGTEYQEQENTVEINNIGIQTSSGLFRGGLAHEQSDFNLKLKKGVTLAAPAVVFAQTVPNGARELYEKALTQFQSKQDAEGQDSLRRALEIFPKYYDALERLGTEYLRMDNPNANKAAEILLSVAVEVNPKGDKSWYGLAFARYSLKQYPTALAAIERTVQLQPQYPQYVFMHGTILRQNKKYAEAEKHLLKSIELSNDQIPRAHWELALLYGNNLKRYADAAKELKLFLHAQPGARDAESIKKLIADFELKAKG